jgi:hypothetical protein
MWKIGIMLLGLVCLGTRAQAAERGFYVGLGTGHGDSEAVLLKDINVDGSIVRGETDDAHRAWRVSVGYALNRYLAVEGAWVQDVWKSRIEGVSDGSGFYSSGPVTHKGNADGWTLEGRLSLPLIGPLTAYAKAGAFWWNVDSVLANAAFGDILDQDDGVDFVFGAGLQYEMARRFYLWGEWQRFQEVSQIDSDVFWGGVRIDF